MDGDPYARMAELMRGGDSAQGARMYLGTVARGTPLEVILGGIRLPKEALRVGAGLSLAEKDSVLLLTEDDQVFYVVMKVVES